MSGLIGPRGAPYDTIKTKLLPLAPGVKAWQGGMACIDTAAANVKPGVSGNANLVRVGWFADTVDNTAGTGTILVDVDLEQEIRASWYDNATGAANITTANLFSDAYVIDDHTVGTTSSGNSKAGRVWAVDSLKGVLVESYTL